METQNVKRTPPSGKATLPELRRDVFDLHECLEVANDKIEGIEQSVAKYDKVYVWGEGQLTRLKKWRRVIIAAAWAAILGLMTAAGASAWTVASGIIWPHVTKADVVSASRRTTDAVAQVVKRSP